MGTGWEAYNSGRSVSPPALLIRDVPSYDVGSFCMRETHTAAENAHSAMSNIYRVKGSDENSGCHWNVFYKRKTDSSLK